MNLEDAVHEVEFVNSREQAEVNLSALASGATDFLGHFGEEYLLGKVFYDIIGAGDGQTKFQRLLSAAGYANSPQGFFAELTEKLGGANGAPIAVGGIDLPNLFVLSILEKIIPGNRYISIRDVSQYEKLANISIGESEREALQEVIETYPVRLSLHTLRQMPDADFKKHCLPVCAVCRGTGPGRTGQHLDWPIPSGAFRADVRKPRYLFAEYELSGLLPLLF